MKVVLHHKPLHSGSKTRGVGVYTRELISAFHKLFPKDKLIPSSNIDYHLDADLIHYPFFDPFFLSLPFYCSKPMVVTIHDLIPLKFPTHFKPGIRGKLKLFFQIKNLKKAKHIITDSEASKKDIINLLNIPKEKISVIPLAHKEEKIPTVMSKKIAKKYKLPERYLLYVGDINWNKNVVGLVEMFSRLSDPSLHLVLLGKVFGDLPNIPEMQRVKAAINNSGKIDKIHLIGFVPTHHLPIFFRHATLYVQPSWYEGFGLPVLEAMTYGCPVASSNRGGLPEVGGDAVAYFDPDKDMEGVVTNLLASTRRRNILVQKGLERVKLFSWEKTARATKAVYEQIILK